VQPSSLLKDYVFQTILIALETRTHVQESVLLNSDNYMGDLLA
jgi:hypothetical protein